MVCMDRDLDNFLGVLIRHPRIVYTHGYSWENDVWSPRSTVETFKAISNRTEETEAISEIESAFALFRRILRWPLLAHALLVTNGLLGVTNADLERAIVRGAGRMPTISSSNLRKAIKGARPKTAKPCVRFPSKAPFSTLNDCYGHLLATFAFHVLAYLLRRHCNIAALGKDVAASVAINASYATIEADEDKIKYYRFHLSEVSLAILKRSTPEAAQQIG